MPQTLDPLAIGAVLALVGMGGTLLSLSLLSLIMSLLKRLFPIERERGAVSETVGGSAPPAAGSREGGHG